MNRFELYRFRHPDGRSKEWAYRDLGNGETEIRWGPARQLGQFQFKPLRVTLDRARTKLRQGYTYVGSVWLDAHGRPTSSAPSATADRRRPALKLSDLLGPTDDSFYF